MNIKYTKKLILFIALVLSSFRASAQTLGEALQYSFYDYIGTARTAGVGGSFGALGGDQGAIFINPASLGTYKKSEFVFSPTNFSSQSTTEFNGNIVEDFNATDFTFFNGGFVIASKGTRRSKWKTSNIALTYNKVADLDRNFEFDGISTGTIAERFAERANGKTLDELDNFEAGVAYDAGALIEVENSSEYQIDAIDDQEIEKNQIVRNQGGISELGISWGGNYNNQVQVGFSLGISFLKNETDKIYKEDAVDNKSAFRGLTYNEIVETSGSGVNLKLGAIYTGIKGFRIGGSLASPTTYSLSDEFRTSMNYQYVDGIILKQGAAQSPEGRFSYTYNTPWKATGSVAYLLNTGGLKGFVSAEVDYLDYKSGSFDLTSQSEDASDLELQRDLNGQINNELRSTTNVRLGAEVVYDIFRIRAGYNMNGSPYFNDKGTFYSGLSLGGGLRFDKFFFDIAYRTMGTQQGYLPYITLNEENVQLVQLDSRNNFLTATFGVKF